MRGVLHPAKVKQRINAELSRVGFRRRSFPYIIVSQGVALYDSARYLGCRTSIMQWNHFHVGSCHR